GLQLALGIGAYLARFSPIWIPGEQATSLALPVVHRRVGGLLLAATVVLAVRLNAGSRVSGHADRGSGGLGGHVGAPHLIRRASNSALSRPEQPATAERESRV